MVFSYPPPVVIVTTEDPDDPALTAALYDILELAKVTEAPVKLEAFAFLVRRAESVAKVAIKMNTNTNNINSRLCIPREILVQIVTPVKRQL